MKKTIMLVILFNFTVAIYPAAPDTTTKKIINKSLLIAIWYGDNKQVASLIDSKADINKLEIIETPLHSAVKWGNIDIISTLLSVHKSQIIAPLCQAVKMVHTIEQWQKKTAHAPSDQTQHNALATPPTTIEHFPLECLQIMIHYLPLPSLANFRQSSKKCCVAAEYEYAQRLKSRMNLEQEYFKTLLFNALKWTQQREDNAHIINFLKQKSSDLWQAALEA